MIGIVLWSDTRDSKAVIWCEDHGELAYYRRPAHGAHVFMDAGDLVQFDVKEVDKYLRVVNPRRVLERVVPDVEASLRAAKSKSDGENDSRVRLGENVLPFPRLAQSQGDPATDGELERLTVNRP